MPRCAWSIPAQYQRRLKTFDFDITTERYTMRNTPGVELRSYFGSDAAKMDGSLNLAGISDPAVDALVERVIAAKSRDELETAARALDRVLRAGHYWVPHWYKASNNIAYWDKFSRPETKPRFDRGILDTWWYDGGQGRQADAGRQQEPPDTEGGSNRATPLQARPIFGVLLRLASRAMRLISSCAASSRTPNGAAAKRPLLPRAGGWYQRPKAAKLLANLGMKRVLARYQHGCLYPAPASCSSCRR